MSILNPARWGITTRLAVMCGCLAMSAVTTVAVLSYARAGNSLHEQARGSLRAAIEGRAAHIEHSFATILDQNATFAADDMIVAATRGPACPTNATASLVVMCSSTTFRP